MVNRPILVLYDIVDDARRNRIRAVLGDLGDRIQQSGWLIAAGGNVAADSLVAVLAGFAGTGDRIRVYSPCPSCTRDARWLPVGQPFTVATVPGWVVSSVCD
jgi:CRISPR-associated endonuclease Cas2